MAAPLEARLLVSQISKFLSCARNTSCSYMIQSRQMGFLNKLKFLQRQKEEQKAEKEEDIVTLDTTDSSSQVRQFRKRLSIEEVKSYKPPRNVEEFVRVAVIDHFGDREDWLNIKLDNRIRKFDFLTQLMYELDHDIPNMELNSINTVEDVVRYFSVEVKDTSPLEDLSKLDLPKNLHINQDYIRFHADTDKIFDGVTAFPGSKTIVSSIKFKRKYKGYDGGDPVNYPEQFTKKA
ncbi:hypothetical protein ACF0H5_016526 [Mactra antiquata]